MCLFFPITACTGYISPKIHPNNWSNLPLLPPKNACQAREYKIPQSQETQPSSARRCGLNSKASGAMERISEAINQPRKRPEIAARARRASAARRRGTKYSLRARDINGSQVEAAESTESNETGNKDLFQVHCIDTLLYHDASILLQFPHVQLLHPHSKPSPNTYLFNFPPPQNKTTKQPRLRLQFCTGIWHAFRFEMRKSLMPRSRASLFSTGTWIVAFPRGWMATWRAITPCVQLEKKTGKTRENVIFNPVHVSSFTLSC